MVQVVETLPVIKNALFCKVTVDIVAADDLATEVTIASAAMALT